MERRKTMRNDHMNETIYLVRNEIAKKAGRKRLSFWQFLKTQIRFIGWKIWVMQLVVLGVVYACMTGFFEKYYTEHPEDLPRLYESCRDGADLAIGSRYCNGISVINWPIGRVIMSYYASVYVRTALGMKVYDTTAGFKCYKRQVLETIDLDKVKMKGYGFQIEMKYSTYKLGFKIQEVPIIFVDRKEGTSKMSSGIFGEAFWGVLKLKLRKIKPRQK
jgi:hypothetical protein